MLRIERVLGGRHDGGFAEALERLAHRGAIDVVHVPLGDLSRRLLLVTTRGGEELAIALPQDQKLFDGAVLLLDDRRAIVVEVAAAHWLRLEPRSIGDAIELGYHVGNLHWRVRLAGEVLLVALEGRSEDYIARLDGMIESRRVGVTVLDEESGEGRTLSDDGSDAARDHSH